MQYIKEGGFLTHMISKPISLKPLSVMHILSGVTVFLVIASLTGQLLAAFLGHPSIFGLVPLFNVNIESNIPTFYATFLLLIVTLFLVLITLLEKSRNGVDIVYWRNLSCIFFCMAVDEFVSLHEMLVIPLRRLLGTEHLGMFYFTWVIPGMLVVLVFTLYFLRFWLSLELKTRQTFFVAGVLFISGCIGMEMIGGWYADIHGTETLVYSLLTTVEESLEMCGVLVFIWGLMGYITENFKEIHFCFNTGKSG